MNIIEIIEPMKQLPGAFVDANFRQGREVVLALLNQRSGGGDALRFVDAGIEDAQERIVALQQRSLPYIIPPEYIFFLEYYGGLSFYGDMYSFSTLGIGPMVEEEYSSIDSDNAFHEPSAYGMLKIGRISQGNLRLGGPFRSVDFFLDLAGHIQTRCVISIESQSKLGLDIFTIVKNFPLYAKFWHKIANNFTEWLKLIAQTQGGLGYDS